MAYKHWLYQSFWAWHVYPLSHAVGPVHPFPPHCHQCAATWVSDGGADVAVAELVVVAELLVTDDRAVETLD